MRYLQQNIQDLLEQDPTEYMYGPFDCATGGLLAMGGYWTTGETGDFHGTTFVKITQGDIVVQDGIACWLNGASSPRDTLNALLAHELGHTLGMLHSCGDDASGPCDNRPDQDNALMRSYIGYNRGPIPNIDDVNAITYLYGNTVTSTTTTSGTTSSTTTTTSSTTSGSTTGQTGVVDLLPIEGNIICLSNLHTSRCLCKKRSLRWK